MKSILIIGMGKFGRHLAYKYKDLGADVMIVDKDDTIINELSGDFTEAYIGDCTNRATIRELGVSHYDVCYVTSSDDFQTSLEIVSLLKEFGAPFIVARAEADIQPKFLMQMGANEVVYPERDMANRVAIRHNAINVLDYIDLGSDFAVYELNVPDGWLGKNIIALDVRKKYDINIIAVKQKLTGAETIKKERRFLRIASKAQPEDYKFSLITPDYIFSKEDHILIIGKTEDIRRVSRMIREIK